MTYRYISTNLLTGAVQADNLPLTVQSFSRQIGAVGQLTGSLTLQGDAQDVVNVAALETRRSVLWVLQDGVPVWNGIVWDWTHQSILDGTLPFSASTMESLFQHRQIDVLQSYSGDVFDTIRTLLAFATSKTPNGQVAGIHVPAGQAGVNYSVTYQATDLTKVWDAVTAICTAASIEITMSPGLDAGGNPATFVQFGVPHVGAPATQSQTTLRFPGNLVDYGFPRTGSTSANSLLATAPPNGSAASWLSQYPHGQDSLDLAAGYPLIEDSISYSGVGGILSQAQINAYADGMLPKRTSAQETPILTVAAGQHPLIREIGIGDYVSFAATSVLHPATSGGQPGLQTQGRVVGWTVTPPGSNQVEQTKLQLGGIAVP